MPLLKLWNRLLGRSPSEATVGSTDRIAAQATRADANAALAEETPASGDPIRDVETARTGRSSRHTSPAGFAKLPGDVSPNDTSKRNRHAKRAGSTQRAVSTQRAGSKHRPAHATPVSGVVTPADQPALSGQRACSDRSGTGETGAERLATPKRWGLLPRGGRGGDPRLRKLLPSAPVSKVLEIFVGDGSRTCSTFETLASGQPVDDLTYAVIDPFEAGAQGTDANRDSVSVKEYHRRVRGIGASVRVFPGPLATGLQQVAWTIGSVDLVLIGAVESGWADPTVQERIRRLCHAGTVVLVHDGTSWRRCDIAFMTSTRVAA